MVRALFLSFFSLFFSISYFSFLLPFAVSVINQCFFLSPFRSPLCMIHGETNFLLLFLGHVAEYHSSFRSSLLFCTPQKKTHTHNPLSFLLGGFFLFCFPWCLCPNFFLFFFPFIPSLSPTRFCVGFEMSGQKKGHILEFMGHFLHLHISSTISVCCDIWVHNLRSGGRFDCMQKKR